MVLLGIVLLVICQPQIPGSMLIVIALGYSLTLNMNGVLVVGVTWCFPNDRSFEVVIIFLVFRLDLLLREFICDAGP